MYDTFTIASPSPDRQHRALFTLSGEIRFGPPYYLLSIDAYSFGQRIFGSAHLWSPTSALLAVQEWLTLDYSEGPITALLLIDVPLRREIVVAQATKRFLVPEAFEDLVIVYREAQAGHDSVKHVDLKNVQSEMWRPFA